MDAVDLTLAGRWSEVSGLVAATPLDAVLVRLGGELERHRPTVAGATYVLVRCERGDLWATGATPVLVSLVDLAAAPVADDLGPPEIDELSRVDVFGAATRDVVWPARGLGWVVADAYAHAERPPGAPRHWLARAELFAPTDVAGWRAGPGRLRWPLPPRPW